MGLISIGKEQWGQEGGEGVERRIKPEPDGGVMFPTRWRVFGPLGPETATVSAGEPFRAEPLVSAAVEELTSIPDELAAGQITLKGRDVEMVEGTIDLDGLFSGVRGTGGRGGPLCVRSCPE